MVDVNIDKDSECAPSTVTVKNTKGVWQSEWIEVDATESDVDVVKSKPYKFIVTVPKGEKWNFKVKVISERVD